MCVANWEEPIPWAPVLFMVSLSLFVGGAALARRIRSWRGGAGGATRQRSGYSETCGRRRRGMKLSKWQRNVVYMGLAVCLLSLMFPPAIVTYESYNGELRTYRAHPFALDMPTNADIDTGVLLLTVGIIGVATALSVAAGASVARSVRRLGQTRRVAPVVAALTRFAQHLWKADTRAGLWATMKRALKWWLPVWWGCTALALLWGHHLEAAGMAVVGSVILSVAVVVVSLPFGLIRRKPRDVAHAAGWGHTKQIAAAIVFILFASGLALATPVSRWADDMERQRHPSVRHRQAPDDPRADEAVDSLAARLARLNDHNDIVAARIYEQKRRAREDMNLFSRGFMSGLHKAHAFWHGMIGMAASATGAYSLESRSFQRYQDNSREAETYE